MPTVLPFHRRVVDDPAFAADASAFRVHTRWIESEFVNDIAPYEGQPAVEEAVERRTVTVEVAGRRLSVSLPADIAAAGGAAVASATSLVRRKRATKGGVTAGGDALTAPMQGTIVKVAVSEGDSVAQGDLVVVLEAMKMEQPIHAHKAGVVTQLTADVGASVSTGKVLCEIKE